MMPQQFGLAGVGRQRVLDRMEAALLGLARLGGDIDLARRILADDDHRQAGLLAARPQQFSPSAP